MAEEILVNVTPQETRVAIIENGVLQEVIIERTFKRGIVGNVYRGRVKRVLPGMGAAFLDVGLERTAFLHVSDIVEADALAQSRGHAAGAENQIERVLTEGQALTVQVTKDPLGSKGARLTTQLSLASRYLVLLPTTPVLGISQRIESEEERQRLRQAVVDEAPHLAHIDTVAGERSGALADQKPASSPDPTASDAQTGPGPGLGPEAPDTDTGHADANPTSAVDEAISHNPHAGYIIRTAAEGIPEAALAADIRFVDRVWQSLKANMHNEGAPQLIYQELPLVLKLIRDLSSTNAERIRIDSRETYAKAVEFATQFCPEIVPCIEHYPGERPILDLYSTEDEIQKALQRKVDLKSGGHLVIDQTEAMTTIDVNTGAFVGHRNLEETIFKTNLEAAQAIARQLRLRNLGGIIIIDFIDMSDTEHQRQVLRALEKSLDRDHAKTSVSEVTSLGLVQLTRKRTRESLEHVLCESCPTCGGRGSVRTAETVCYEIFREILREVRQFEARRLLVVASEPVVSRLLDEESTGVAELESFVGVPIKFQVEASYTPEQFDVVLL